MSTSESPKFIDIDKVFTDKNPGLRKFIPGFLIRYLKRITHQEEVNTFMDTIKHLYGIEYAQGIVNGFGVKFSIRGEENIPKEGRFVFAANHPLGGMDGMIFVSAVGKYFKHLKFPVNDILMNIKNLHSIFLPINKHGGHSKEAAQMIDKAYASDEQILMFPAGLVSRQKKHGITDLEWKKNFIRKSISHKRTIIPVYISGQNTNFFYKLANWRKRLGIKANIEMLYLVDEMYKQKGKTITITFGKPISHEQLKDGSKADKWAQKIKDYVYGLKN